MSVTSTTTPRLPVDDVRDVGLLGVARSAGRVDDRPLKQLRFARACPLEVRSVHGVELRPEDLADVATADLLRCDP
jgi:hypothetical protein